MGRRQHERLVSFYDLRVESHLRGKPVLPVGVPTADALRIALEEKGTTPYTRGNGTLEVSLQDWQYDKRHREHYLIFNRADASLNDIPLLDLDSRATRMAGKLPTEGIDLTAHVLIREPKTKHAPAVLLLTAGTSLPVAKVVQALTQLFRRGEGKPANEEHFHRDDPSGAAGAKLKLASKFVVDGHQNAFLSEILRSGKLEGLVLVSEDDEMLDEESGLLITATEFVVKPMKGTLFSVSRLKQILGNGPKGVDKARVRYKAPGQSETQEHVFRIDELDAAFVRKVRVRFTDPVEDRYTAVNMAVMDKLRTLL